ncbi:MobQ family relaxase [Sulfitobacter sp. M13]
MAIYHLRATMISRSQGRSATAASAYRVAERIEDRRTGLTFDYAARSGVDHTEILAPDHAPDWVRDRSELWNRVEESETRKNSQVAREVRVALPDELTHAQRVALVRDYAQAQFVDRGMVADIALHAPGREGDERNHHAHILLTTRELDAEGSVPGGGFTTKNRDWNKVEVLEGWREAWARDSNAALERAGLEDRVDHRTLVAQRDEALELASAARERGDEGAELNETVRAMSLDRPPLPQLSLGAWQLKERGIEVAAVRVWHEVKDRAAEVRQVVQELTGQVRDWLDRAAERVMDRLEPARFAGSGQSELALAGGRDGREEEPDRSDRSDLATRLRDAWEARQGREKEQGVDAPERDAPEPQDLAARLREAAAGIDPDALADRAAALREGREAEERHIAQEAAREQERVKELERQQEIEREAHRDRGHGIER